MLSVIFPLERRFLSILEEEFSSKIDESVKIMVRVQPEICGKYAWKPPWDEQQRRESRGWAVRREWDWRWLVRHRRVMMSARRRTDRDGRCDSAVGSRRRGIRMPPPAETAPADCQHCRRRVGWLPRYTAERTMMSTGSSILNSTRNRPSKRERQELVSDHSREGERERETINKSTPTRSRLDGSSACTGNVDLDFAVEKG